jgi:hypothetical protein
MSYIYIYILFGYYPFTTGATTIGAEMGKELDYLTKLYLVKAFNVRKIVLEN